MEKSKELRNWAMTLYEVVAEIERKVLEYEQNPEKVKGIVANMDGLGGKWELAYNLTNEFEDLHKDIEWSYNKGYLETLEQFLDSKNL